MSVQDLMFSYENENGEKVRLTHGRYISFLAETAPPLSGKDVDVYFFENPATKQHFATVEDLYHHCKMIMK